MTGQNEKTNYTECLTLSNDLKKGLTPKQLNVLGYIEFRCQYFSDFRAENDDWFFLRKTDIAKATGTSRSKLDAMTNKFLQLGLVAYNSGYRKGEKNEASAWKLLYDYKRLDLHNEGYIEAKKGTLEGTLNNVDLQELNEKGTLNKKGTLNEKGTSVYRIKKKEESMKNLEFENLEVKQTEVKETELVKALKRIEVLEEKVNYFESNQKTLFQTVGELVERFNNILQNPFFNNIPSADAGNNLPSNGSERKPEGIDCSNESGKNEPSTGRFNKQQAEELEKSFNYFIKNLRNYEPQEQERAMQAFTSKAKATYTGDWIERKVKWMENSYRGMWKSINDKQPSNEQAFKEENTKPQPANNGLSETDLYNEINNTFSVENYSPATAQKSRERLQGLVFNGNVTSEQKRNLLNHLLRVMNQRDEELKAEKEAQTSPSETNVTNNTTNTTSASNEPEMGLPEPTTANTEGELSTSSDYFRLTYEANQLKNKSEATDFLMNNKNRINALSAGQRAKVLDICRKLIA